MFQSEDDRGGWCLIVNIYYKPSLCRSSSSSSSSRSSSSSIISSSRSSTATMLTEVSMTDVHSAMPRCEAVG